MEPTRISLSTISSLRIGGEGEVVTVTSLREMVEAVRYAKAHSKKVHIVGGGTNSFFGDHLEEFLFIRMALLGVSFEEQGDSVRVTASSGEWLDTVIATTTVMGLWGLENLSHIPGTVGASPVQNVGAYGAEIAFVCESVEALDLSTLDLVKITRDACDFGYRTSMFKKNPGKYAILSVTFLLSKVSSPRLTYAPLTELVCQENITPKEIREKVIEVRTHKLPDYHEYPNAGSFFKNPVVESVKAEGLRVSYPDIPLIAEGEGYKIPAAWLIEHVGEAKGLRVGNIGTWPKQPLIIVNFGDADVQELLAFTDALVTKIEAKIGVHLEREVNYIEGK